MWRSKEGFIRFWFLFLLLKRKEIPCSKVGRVAQSKTNKQTNGNSAESGIEAKTSVRCLEMMGSKAIDYELLSSLYLPL